LPWREIDSTKPHKLHREKFEAEMVEPPISPAKKRPGVSCPIEIRVEGLYKAFGDKRVLDGIDIQVCRGELIAIVGSSGSGKSTLLRLFTGHFKPDRGRVLVADHESEGSPPVDLATLDSLEMERLQRHWAVVFQGNGLLAGTVYDNIALPLRLVQGLDEKTIGDRITEVLLAVGLDPNKDAQISVDQLSGGMRKRAAIARALAIDPALMFYDEPTTGLDPARSWQIQDLIQAANERRTLSGCVRTSIAVTHDKDLLRRLQPRIVMLDGGHIVFDGNYESFHHSDSPLIRPYVERMPLFQQSGVA
jgi:phospholipid/cholesterol/gamma-HCH transport system ATP-binding protein